MTGSCAAISNIWSTAHSSAAFRPAGFVSLSGFHRKVDGFIQPNTFRVDDPTLGVVEITGPVNTGEGRITGLELQGQIFADFDSLPDWARGFGMQVNVTYIDAETEQPDGQGGLSFQPITGLPFFQPSGAIKGSGKLT